MVGRSLRIEGHGHAKDFETPDVVGNRTAADLELLGGIIAREAAAALEPVDEVLEAMELRKAQ